MSNNSENSNISENKNVSEYEQLKQEAKIKGKQTAEYYIKRLYEALKKEGHRPEEIKGILLHDLIDVWSKATIDKFIPVEAKDEQKVEAGKIGQKKKLEIKLSNEGNIMKDDNILLEKTQAEQTFKQENKPDLTFSQNHIKPESIRSTVTIKLGMNDSKDIKNVVNRINLMKGFSFTYNLQTNKIESIQT